MFIWVLFDETMDWSKIEQNISSSKTLTDWTKHPDPNPSNISLIPTLRRKKDNKRSLRVLHWKNGVLHSGPLGKFLKDLLSC